MTKTIGQTSVIRVSSAVPALLIAICCGVNFLQSAYAQGSDDYSNTLDSSQTNASQPRDYDSVHTAGMNAYKQGDDELAERLLAQAVQLAREFPEDDPRVLECAHDLGQFYYMTFKYNKAEICFQQVLEISQKTLNPSDPRIGDALSDVVMVWRHLGKGDKVEPLLKKALKIRYESLGVSDIKVANTLLDLATFYEDNNQLAQSAMYYKKAIQLKEDILGSGSPKISAIRGRYSNILAQLGTDDSTIATASVLPGSSTPGGSIDNKQSQFGVSQNADTASTGDDTVAKKTGTGTDSIPQDVSSVSSQQPSPAAASSSDDNMKVEMSSDESLGDNSDSAGSTGMQDNDTDIKEGDASPIPARGSSASTAQAGQPAQRVVPANSNLVK